MATIRWTGTAEDAYLALLQVVYSNSTQAAILLDDKLEQLLSGFDSSNIIAHH